MTVEREVERAQRRSGRRALRRRPSAIVASASDTVRPRRFRDAGNSGTTVVRKLAARSRRDPRDEHAVVEAAVPGERAHELRERRSVCRRPSTGRA